MTLPRFIQIHTLHNYPAALLNRDDAGLAKRLPYGDKVRTRSVEAVAEGPDSERVMRELARDGCGLIFATSERGTTFVYKASPAGFEFVAENKLGDEAFATPTFCGNRVYLRVASTRGGQRQETLYCVGRE